MFSYHTPCHESDDQMKGHANTGLPLAAELKPRKRSLITADNTASSGPAARNERVFWEPGLTVAPAGVYCVALQERFRSGRSGG